MNKQTNIMTRFAILFAILLLPFGLTGCGFIIKPYEVPKYVEVAPNETAFMIPLDASGQAQAKFESAEFLNERKVAARRINIPRRWVSTGFMPGTGEYIDTVRVITVNRAPVTREWEPDDDTNRDNDMGIWVESRDSIGFSTGFSVTAHITEEDTALFLYNYPASSLAQVMDQEVRARMQSVAADASALFKMDLLREKKTEIISAIRQDVIPFFKAKGITVTTIGQFGGFTYENPRIQDSIDETFVAQQEQVVSAAQLAAQTDKNARIELAAVAEANAKREVAQAEADAKLMVATAEADGIRQVNKALAEANQNPQLIELKRLEVEMVRAETWDGAYPVWLTTGGASGANLLLDVGSGPSSEKPVKFATGYQTGLEQPHLNK